MTTTRTPLTPTVVKTSATLADGREIIFYDDSAEYVSGEKTRTIHDPRPLEARTLPPHDAASIRTDPLTGYPVAIAAHRQNRTFLPPADEDPLAPAGQGSVPSEIPEPEYDVVVFENRFPSLQGPYEVLNDSTLNYETTPAGRCEVVCFTSNAVGSFATLSQQRARTVFEAWKDRTKELLALNSVREVFIFENNGEEIGVTLHHPHGQIYGYSYLTPYTTALKRQTDAYAQKNRKDLLADVLLSEVRDGRRIIRRTENFTAYVPFAAKWPVEFMIMPHKAVKNFTGFTSEELDELSELYLDLLGRLNRYFDGIELPYISAWHQAPSEGAEHISRMFLHVFSLKRAPEKLKYLAGSESAMAAWINDRTPEEIAARLKEVELP
ncbi:galactose-1-phosphate uridylyltransferase [Rothia sp. P7208]|uniref:galactose-1-phosphate uridylyltransferase n=1 Tax=Rothia sp. P7208 TaxID=3402660 RepID=UPI003AC9923C